jgi:hypothetical protein
MGVSFEPADLERIRAVRGGLDPQAPQCPGPRSAIKVLEELQRLEGRDRRIKVSAAREN